MTNNFVNRIDAITAKLELEKIRRSDTSMDDLSKSLYEFGDHLAALDDLGVVVEAAELEITPEAVKNMACVYARPLWY